MSIYSDSRVRPEGRSQLDVELDKHLKGTLHDAIEGIRNDPNLNHFGHFDTWGSLIARHIATYYPKASYKESRDIAFNMIVPELNLPGADAWKSYYEVHTSNPWHRRWPQR